MTEQKETQASLGLDVPKTKHESQADIVEAILAKKKSAYINVNNYREYEEIKPLFDNAGLDHTFGESDITPIITSPGDYSRFLDIAHQLNKKVHIWDTQKKQEKRVQLPHIDFSMFFDQSDTARPLDEQLEKVATQIIQICETSNAPFVDILRAPILDAYHNKSYPMPLIERLITLTIKPGHPITILGLATIGNALSVHEGNAVEVIAECCNQEGAYWNDRSSQSQFDTLARLLNLPPQTLSYENRMNYSANR